MAYLLAPICLLSGCQGASVGSLGAPDQSSSSVQTSSATLVVESSSQAAAATSPSSEGPDDEHALVGSWVLRQVQTGTDLPRAALPGKTTLLIQGGFLLAVDACSQQIQAQVTVGQSTLTLTNGIYGGGFAGSPDHPCGDLKAVDFWNDSTTFKWKVAQSRLVISSDSMTLFYGLG